MCTENTQVRYIHINDPGQPRCTVAYFRTEELVMYAYSEVSEKDQYSKAIGREVSCGRLLDSVDPGMEVMLKSLSENDASSVISYVNRVGLFTVDYMLSELDLYTVMSDQSIADLNMFSFKHAVISAVVSNCVLTKENTCL